MCRTLQLAAAAAAAMNSIECWINVRIVFVVEIQCAAYSVCAYVYAYQNVGHNTHNKWAHAHSSCGA